MRKKTTTVLQIKAMNLWGGIPFNRTIEIANEEIPTIFEHQEPGDEKPRAFRLKSVEQLKMNYYRATYVQEKSK